MTAHPTFHPHQKLDESTASRQLKSPRSLSGRSIHLTFVTKWSWSWSWMTYCHPLCAMLIGPSILRYSYFKIWPWKSMVKVMCVVKDQGHVWPSKSKVKVKPIGHIWGLEFNRYICFLFCGNRTTFGWNMANSIFYLENSRSRSWPRSNLMVTFEPESSIDMFAFRFVAIGPFLAEIKQIVYLTLKIQGQGQGQGQTRWSHLSPRVQSICLLFVSWQSDRVSTVWKSLNRFANRGKPNRIRLPDLGSWRNLTVPDITEWLGMRTAGTV